MATRLTDVHFWPETGFVDRPWLDEPVADALVKSSRRVCERYSEALRELDLPNAVGSLQLIIRQTRERPESAEPTAPTVQVDVNVDRPEGGEWAGVLLPAEAERLSGTDRAHLVLEIITGVLTRLAAARGWDPDLIQQAHRHVLDHGLGFSWAGPWKNSPNRRSKGRCSFDLTDDGFGRITLEVADATTGATVARSRQFTAYSTLEGFQRSARTLRWEGSRRLTVIPLIDLVGRADDLVEFDLDEGAVGVDGARALPVPAGKVVSPLPVHVVGKGATAPEQPHEILFMGIDRRRRCSREYVRTLEHLLHLVEGEEAWLRWWSASPAALLDIFTSFDNGRQGIRVRRTGSRVNAAITRAAKDQLRGPEGVQQARDDVTALVGRLRGRFELAEPPALPDTATLTRLPSGRHD